jgi:ubiquinone biosynthesis protein
MKTKLSIVKFALKHFRALKKFKGLDPGQQAVSDLPEKFISDILKAGPTFIKLGQILSTRPDIMPSRYIQALSRLQENVPPFSFDQARQVVEREFERPLADIFLEFNEHAEASASLAQVHFAVLHSGEPVAVKIQRPGIRSQVKREMALIEGLISTIRLFAPRLIKRANLLNGFLEFKRYTIQELDFLHEGDTIERFAVNFKEWEDIVLPRVYREYTTDKVLIMERVAGMRLAEAVSTLSSARRRQLNTRIAEMEMKMFISDGLFHADLHPGNIFFQKDGKIALLDFGMYGELTGQERDHFVLYWLAVVQNDVKRAFYHFKKQCVELKNAHEEPFYRVFKKLADDFYRTRLVETSIAKVYLSMIRAGYKYGFLFPSNLLLHAKALTTAEALTFGLAPEARFEEVTSSIIAKEFSKLALNRNRVRSRIEKAVPGFLLTGELLSEQNIGSEPVQGYDSHLFWTAIYDQFLDNLKKWQANAGVFKATLNRPAEEVLEEHGWDNGTINKVIREVWDNYLFLEPTLVKQQTLGATFTLHLGAATIAIFKALDYAIGDREKATELIFEIGWKVYSRMSEWPLLIAGMFSDDPRKRMDIATRIFRNFPFTAPDYGWEDVEADSNTVAFNCTRCHVAELFKKHDLADVCYGTWCSLDFPLAEKWGGYLERTNSIAGGAEICDFRWRIPRK